MIVRLETSWHSALTPEFEKVYWNELADSVRNAYQNQVVYPPPKQIFAALDLCPLPKTKVVILGQDPYHGPRQAHGLAFSVTADTAIPPSLQNIYRELASDLDVPVPKHGDLSGWAKEGVLLLNTTLTVAAGRPLSHRDLGWETFTDSIITTLAKQTRPLVFLLWGKHAHSKQPILEGTEHLVLTAPHPSPLSAHRGFFSCRHFSKANDFLRKTGQKPITWEIISRQTVTNTS